MMGETEGRRGGAGRKRPSDRARSLVRRPDAPHRQGRAYFDVEAALAALTEGRPVIFPPFELVHWGGLTFALNYRRDPIQNEIRHGRFYERRELGAVAERVAPGAVCVDIGANIGNHALFFATQMQASRVIVVEPNPLAIAPLLANVLTNGLTEIIWTDLLGVGFAEDSEEGLTIRRHRRNLGATRMTRGKDAEGGEDGVDQRIQTGFTVHAGDDLLEGERPDFIKIDVEGMEMRVLAGLARTIARSRPLMLVEVEKNNGPAFDRWISDNGYERLQHWSVGDTRSNHLVGPLAGRTDDPANGKEGEPC